MDTTYRCQEKEEGENLEDFLKFYGKIKKIQINDVVSCQTGKTE